MSGREDEYRTERLLLRPLRLDDEPAVTAYRGDGRAARFLRHPPLAPGGYPAWLAERSAEWELAQPGHRRVVGIEELATGRLVGDAVIVRRTDACELGMFLHPDTAGLGYSLEAGRALLRLVFETLGSRQVVGRADPRNRGSVKAMELLGLRRREQAEGDDSVEYASTVEAWRAGLHRTPRLAASTVGAPLPDGTSTMASSTARIGLGLAAVGRPAYITAGRDGDLGPPQLRSIDALRARTHELLDTAWSEGVRFVDVARSYGRAEEFLGSWLAAHPERRAGLIVESKWGYEYVGDWAMDAPVHERKEHSVAMFERQWSSTLEALGSAPDCYLVHSITPESPALTDRALLDRLRGLAASGVRVGLSTSGPGQGRTIALALAIPESPFSAVQTTWNLLERSAEAALADAHDAGWLVVVKEALANGRLVGERAPEAVRRLVDAPEDRALGAALAQPWADRVLSGAATPAQLLENLRARPAALPEGLEPQDPEQYWAERSALAWR